MEYFGVKAKIHPFYYSLFDSCPLLEHLFRQCLLRAWISMPDIVAATRSISAEGVKAA
jgi:hypothetical protein